jgi:L-ascorbate 6-phosphate lactonase
LRKYDGQNAVLFDEETEWTVGDVLFKAVKAVHSDEKAIGILIKSEGKTIYFTGDTLYSEKVLRAVEKEEIDAVFLPINGKGNNMNGIDAARLAKAIKAKRVYPMHYGMFDEIDPNTFVCENTVIMNVYETFEL